MARGRPAGPAAQGRRPKGGAGTGPGVPVISLSLGHVPCCRHARGAGWVVVCFWSAGGACQANRPAGARPIASGQSCALHQDRPRPKPDELIHCIFPFQGVSRSAILPPPKCVYV